jgi:hypothetical protein
MLTMLFAMAGPLLLRLLARSVSVLYAVAQIVLVLALVQLAWKAFSSGVFLVNNKPYIAPSQLAAEELARVDAAVRATAHATGRDLRASMRATAARDVAGVTRGKNAIELCITGKDNGDAVMAVALHEAAHALNRDSYGHGPEFRRVQDELVRAARELGHIREFERTTVCGHTVSWPIQRGT